MRYFLFSLFVVGVVFGFTLTGFQPVTHIGTGMNHQYDLVRPNYNLNDKGNPGSFIPVGGPTPICGRPLTGIEDNSEILPIIGRQDQQIGVTSSRE